MAETTLDVSAKTTSSQLEAQGGRPVKDPNVLVKTHLKFVCAVALVQLTILGCIVAVVVHFVRKFW